MEINYLNGVSARIRQSFQENFIYKKNNNWGRLYKFQVKQHLHIKSDLTTRQSHADAGVL